MFNLVHQEERLLSPVKKFERGEGKTWKVTEGTLLQVHYSLEASCWCNGGAGAFIRAKKRSCNTVSSLSFHYPVLIAAPTTAANMLIVLASARFAVATCISSSFHLLLWFIKAGQRRLLPGFITTKGKLISRRILRGI